MEAFFTIQYGVGYTTWYECYIPNKKCIIKFRFHDLLPMWIKYVDNNFEYFSKELVLFKTIEESWYNSIVDVYQKLKDVERKSKLIASQITFPSHSSNKNVEAALEGLQNSPTIDAIETFKNACKEANICSEPTIKYYQKYKLPHVEEVENQ